MRIYFVGSHATGKTTMTRWVSRRFGVPMITEVARSVLAELETNFESLRTDMDRVGDYQRRVFERQIATERAQERGFVSDRAFDNLAYAAEHATAARAVGATRDTDGVRHDSMIPSRPPAHIGDRPDAALRVRPGSDQG